MVALFRCVPFCWVCAVVLVAAVGVADHINSPEVNCATLYLLPILWVTWCVGFRPGLLVAFGSIATWLVADYGTLRQGWPVHVMAWDALMRAGVYVTVVYVMSALKEARDHESELARTDSLTAVANTRSFNEIAARELDRARRRAAPFTVAYIDLDNFKDVNDRLGHNQGDTLLREVAAVIRGHVRSTDVVARVGGDEFVILFPETGKEAADDLLNRVRTLLLEVVRRNGGGDPTPGAAQDGGGAGIPPVTLSIGAVTFLDAPQSVDEAIKRADDLMYSVKRSGKNGLAHAMYRSTGQNGATASPAS